MALLELKGLRAGYDDLEILKGISINAGAGQITAIIGPNGAGKSTVLKSIFGGANVTSGSIKFRGEDIGTIKPFELIELGIGYVPQGRNVFDTLTVRENLELGYILANEGELVEKKKLEMFRRFPFMAEKAHEKALSLSGGQRQLLGVTRALMSGPRLLLLDEPTIGLEPKAVSEVFSELENVRSEGIAVLLVEQNAKKAIGIADMVYLLEDGKVVLSGNGREIIRHRAIRHVYLGGI